MSQSHETTVPNTPEQPHRDAKGRFTAGNGGGPGNPFGRRLAAMRQAVMRAVSVDDIEALMRKLLEMALAGDLAAAKLVLQYAVGKPKAVTEPDRVEVEAWDIEQQKWANAEQVEGVLAGMPVLCATVSSDALTDVRCRQYKEMLENPETAVEETFTEEQKREALREFEEANARVEAMLAEQAAAPSSAGTNGHANGRPRPSNAKANGRKNGRETPLAGRASDGSHGRDTSHRR